MGASFLPVLIFSAIWGVVGIILPFMVPRGPHKSVIQVIYKIIYSYASSKIQRINYRGEGTVNESIVKNFDFLFKVAISLLKSMKIYL